MRNRSQTKMTKPKHEVRFKNVEYGTVFRVIRVVRDRNEKYNASFYGRDETYGGLCWLPFEQVMNGNWVIYEPDSD